MGKVELEKKIRAQKEELAKLENELKTLNERPADQQLADLVHSVQCTRDHTEHCFWYYESWEKPGSTRSQYIRHARSLIQQGYDLDKVTRIIGEYKTITTVR